MVALETNSQGKWAKTDCLALSGQDSQQATWKWKPWMLLLSRSQRTPSLWEGHCFGFSYSKPKNLSKRCSSLRTILRECWAPWFPCGGAEPKKARAWILWWAGGYQLMKTSAARCLVCHRGSVSVVIWVMVAFLFFFFPHFLFLVCSHEIFNLDP